jgi:hypothetical protein
VAASSLIFLQEPRPVVQTAAGRGALITV